MSRFILVFALCACVQSGAASRLGQALIDPSTLPLSWVAIGDSTTMDLSSPTRGWPTQAGADWPGHDVNNIAVPGSTVLDAGPAYPTLEAQWSAVRATEPRGLFQHGGFNDIVRNDDTGEQIFGRMLVIADDALDAGWTVAFVSPLPCGGNCSFDQSGKREVIIGLEKAWASEHGQVFLNFDASPINCGALFGDGIQTLCDWARYGGTDCVHPSPEAQRVLGQWAADRMMAPELP